MTFGKPISFLKSAEIVSFQTYSNLGTNCSVYKTDLSEQPYSIVSLKGISMRVFISTIDPMCIEYSSKWRTFLE